MALSAPGGRAIAPRTGPSIAGYGVASSNAFSAARTHPHNG
jgi:hypothetical protein